MKRRMVLASKSPRRRELLEMLGAQFEVITSDCDENITGLAPRDLVRELALRKAEAVYERLNDPDAVVIGSDTIVTPDGVKALGKPRDRGDAVRTLTELSGKWHSVCTGIAVIGRKKIEIPRPDKRGMRTIRRHRRAAGQSRILRHTGQRRSARREDRRRLLQRRRSAGIEAQSDPERRIRHKPALIIHRTTQNETR